MLQNSGLGNAISPLTSLTYTFRIPLLLIVTHRGEQGSLDEPQHQLMGEITKSLLRTVRVPFAPFPDTEGDVADELDKAVGSMATTGLPFALVMRRGGLEAYERRDAAERSRRECERFPGDPDAAPASMLRSEVVGRVADVVSPAAAIVATTGKTARELFSHADRPGNFYMVGSMGCAPSIGLGVALIQPERQVVVLDGDGAALMRLEAMAAVGHYAPENLVHVVVDNGVHDSTGGQTTVASTVRFDGIACATSYETAEQVACPATLAKSLERCLHSRGPHLIHALVQRGCAADLGRPTLAPVEAKKRFMRFLQQAPSHASMEGR